MFKKMKIISVLRRLKVRKIRAVTHRYHKVLKILRKTSYHPLMIWRKNGVWFLTWRRLPLRVNLVKQISCYAEVRRSFKRPYSLWQRTLILSLINTQRRSFISLLRRSTQEPKITRSLARVHLSYSMSSSIRSTRSVITWSNLLTKQFNGNKKSDY